MSKFKAKPLLEERPSPKHLFAAGMEKEYQALGIDETNIVLQKLNSRVPLEPTWEEGDKKALEVHDAMRTLNLTQAQDFGVAQIEKVELAVAKLNLVWQGYQSSAIPAAYKILRSQFPSFDRKRLHMEDLGAEGLKALPAAARTAKAAREVLTGLHNELGQALKELWPFTCMASGLPHESPYFDILSKQWDKVMLAEESGVLCGMQSINRILTLCRKEEDSMQIACKAEEPKAQTLRILCR